MVNIEREKFIGPFRKEVDESSTFNKRPNSKVHDLSNTEARTADLQMGERVVQHQPSRNRDRQSLPPLVKFPGKWPACGGIAKENAFVGLPFKVARSTGPFGG